MISYPEKLPCFRAEYSYAQNNTITSTEFQSGFKRNRRRFKDVPVNFNLSLLLTDEQLAIFEAWRYYELEDVDWFNATLKTGQGLETWTVRFNSTDESKTYNNGYWNLSFTAEAKKNKFISQEDLYAKIYGLPEDFGDRIQTIVKRYDTDYYL